MQFIKPGINLDFIGKRQIGFWFSLTLILITIVTLVIHKGPKYGIDFAGGTIIQIQFQKEVNVGDIRKGLDQVGLGGSAVQAFGERKNHEYLIRAQGSLKTDEKTVSAIKNAIEESTGAQPVIRRNEMVGPKVGKDLREKALLAMFFALLFITIYISGRFEHKWLVSIVIAVSLAGAVSLLKLINTSIPLLMLAALLVTLVLFVVLRLKYAMGAIVALIHDVMITVGIFSLMNKEFTLPIIAALLTIIGYSLNDTIIVFDRIRENLKKFHKNPLSTTINTSINETLNRTVLTSLTTLIVVITLYILGVETIRDFAFAMIIGVVIGTYSSIFVASPILFSLEEYEKKKT